MFRDRVESAWLAPPKGVVHAASTLMASLILLVLLSGCGASAHKDFDLNKGEASGDDPAAENAFSWDEWFGAEADSEASSWTYELGGGDKLEIAFFSHPDQNRFVTVRPDGMISLPYVGEIQAAGKSAQSLGDELEATYAEVLIDPVVDVIVQETGAKYYVIGEVLVPGEFPFERRVTLLQALAAARGYTDEAKLSSFVLMRKREDGTRAAAIFNFRDYMGASQRRGDIPLRPYDIVWVPRDGLSRFDSATKKAFQGILAAQEVAIRGWSLANFDEVFKKGIQRP